MYRFLKSMNNNIVLAKNNRGKEVILVGTGIGFHRVLNEEIIESEISRIYRLDDYMNYTKILDSLPNSIIDLIDSAVLEAEKKYRLELNPNVYVLLADHINTVIQRKENMNDFGHPLATDIRLLYPVEYALGEFVIKEALEKFDMLIPNSEVSYIALHFLNAQLEKSDTKYTMKLVKISKEVVEIINDFMGIDQAPMSLVYSRFMAHLRFFLMSLRDEVSEDRILVMNQSSVSDFSESHKISFECASQVIEYLNDQYKLKIIEDEIFYLAIHIERMFQAFNKKENNYE